MPAPSAGNGGQRALEELTIPTGGTILLIALAYTYYGEIVAGLLLVGITVLGLIALASVAKYWNIEYTIGFIAVGGIVLFFIPSVLSKLTHPLFAILSDIVLLVGLIFLGLILFSKLDSGGSSRRL